ncbi:MAG TPA: CNP1-like family protein [Burkholderiales bacterium]|nr:CNP1-like family protein [Burkholderiales bacterium]
MRTTRRAALAALLLAFVAAACSEGKSRPPPPSGHGNRQIDTGGQVFLPEAPWQESEVQLPPYPDLSGLQPFDIAGPSNYRFLVDPRSISIGADRVVRYTVVARSASGTNNVSYEGIRCETREWKTYAYGRSDGTWASARDAQWQHVPSALANAFRYALYRDYFCSGGAPVPKAEDALAEMKRVYGNGPGGDRKSTN